MYYNSAIFYLHFNYIFNIYFLCLTVLNIARKIPAVLLCIFLPHTYLKQKTNMKKILIFATAMVFAMSASLMATAQNASTKTQPQKATSSVTTKQEHQKTAVNTDPAAKSLQAKLKTHPNASKIVKTSSAKTGNKASNKNVKTTTTSAAKAAPAKTAQKPAEHKK